MLSIFLLGLVIAFVFFITLLWVVESFKRSLLTTKFMIISGLIIFIGSFYLSLKVFTNMIWYNYDNKDVASKGIFFKDTLIPSEHRLIGTSDYVILKIDKYSRSDIQLEVINVIVNDNKTKDINEQ